MLPFSRSRGALILNVPGARAEMLNFRLGASGQSLTISDSAMQHFSSRRQRKIWNRESGGQLFAEIVGVDIVITTVTGPRRSDRRSRFSYRPNRRLEQIEIDRQFANGLHYVGDWHTHPGTSLRHSTGDLSAMRLIDGSGACSIPHPISLIYSAKRDAIVAYCYEHDRLSPIGLSAITRIPV